MSDMNVGITGQSGFIGGHLLEYLRRREGVTLIPFEDEYFEDERLLTRFAADCDCIVHLAAMNRGDEKMLYDVNIRLVRDLVRAIRGSGNSPSVVFASSIQELRDTPYGRSKRDGRKILETWARETGSTLTSLLIPNVFGPFGKPFHNSVIGTFCYQLTHGQRPKIHVDAELPLIDVGSLVGRIVGNIQKSVGPRVTVVEIAPLAVRRVSDLLGDLQSFSRDYLQGGVIPHLADVFEVALFNTFHSYIDPGEYPRGLLVRVDRRGCLAEIVKSANSGQAYMSITRPGVVRGNHFHTRKIERFLVLSGEAVVRTRRLGSEAVTEYPLTASEPSYVDIPVFHVHNLENTGQEDLLTLFWSTELFRPADPDTFPEEV